MPIGLWLIVAIPVVVILVFFYLVFLSPTESEKLRKAVSAAPLAVSTKVRSGDIVKVQGTVHPLSEPVLSPINSIPCVCYSVVIRRFWSDGDSSGWDELVNESSEEHFELIALAGKIVIEPKESKFIEAKDQLYTRCYDSSEFESGFLERHDSELVFSGEVEFYEEVIYEHELLVAMGRGEQLRSDEGELRLHLRHQKRTPLHLSKQPSLLEEG